MRLNVTVVVVVAVTGRAAQLTEFKPKKKSQTTTPTRYTSCSFWSGGGKRGRGGEKQIELGWMGEGQGKGKRVALPT